MFNSDPTSDRALKGTVVILPDFLKFKVSCLDILKFKVFCQDILKIQGFWQDILKIQGFLSRYS